MKPNRKAFTLIELLVVIAIIGLLATISVIALNNARAKARDAKRIADVKQIQTALELFYNDMNRYPTTAEFTSGFLASYSSSTGSTTTYMAIIPAAATPADGACSDNQNRFSYSAPVSGASYTLSYCLGGTTGALASGPKCADAGGTQNIDCSGSGSGFVCGSPITVTSIAGHVCNVGAPDYDTCTYGTVQIGMQCWMKQNMNIGSYVNHYTVQTSNSIIEKWCWGDSLPICSLYGGLYQWDEAMQYSLAPGSQGICPPGWHIPTDAEFTTLAAYATANGYPGTEGIALKASPANIQPWDGTDISGFSAIQTRAFYTDGPFYFTSGYALLWSSTYLGPDAWFRSLTSHPTFDRNHYDRTYGFSIRCIED